MTPTPTTSPASMGERKFYSRTHALTHGDEIVISGIAGQFPNSQNVEELAYNLYNKIDMVDDSEKRWRHFNVEIPMRMGKISNINKFDATFFGVHFKQAHTMDPQCRILLEKAYEAVLDAGVHPKSLRGTKTGVFVGACFSESEKTWFYEKISSSGFGLTGCCRSMLSNRVSYILGCIGPSFLLDTACSSSMYALDSAFSAIRNGECDAALVGGTNLLIHPYVTLQFARLGVLSKDGYCRPFDVDATGYSRAEAICMIYLQKAKDAKRNYANVLYSKTNCDGYKTEGVTYPSGALQEKLLSEFYNDVGISPATVSYVEAHSTGTIVGDPEECSAIDHIFCKDRTEPLLVGSIKSNIGHSESSAGTCSIVKVILAYETGLVAPNINFTKPRPGIVAFEEGRLKVCMEPTKLEGSLIGINSFGFGGANAHALFKQNAKEKKNNGTPNDKIPRLINWAGRTEDSLTVMFEALEKRPLDAEFISLIHSAASDDTVGYIFRGYGIYNHQPTGNAVCIGKEMTHYTGLRRPTVWVFSGMGSQWPEMGSSLLQLPIIRESIQKSHNLLQPLGLNLINILTSPDKNTYDNILNSFVGIAAMQVAIVDVLRAVGIEADYYIGHSFGELGCAYADGCLTADQMLLSAYSRGIVSLETKKIQGSMAAVGIGYKNIRSMVPLEIEVACHNGPDSATISGPEEDVGKFVDELKAQGIFAKEVPCSKIAYHSKYIADMGPELLARLTKVIPVPKKRSAKWLSSSIPKNRWNLDESQFNSAKYHTNNLLSPVLFEETLAHLPPNSLTIEIAPHGLLQAILKKSMVGGLHVPLTQRGNKDNICFFLSALGNLFLSGLNLRVDRLYPPVEFPVSRGTQMIAPLIRWDHSEDWFVTKFELQRTSRSSERKVNISLSDQDYDFIAGHAIDGRCLFPATGYLQLVWETLAMMKGPIFFDINVEFTDIRLLRATSIVKGQVVELTIMIHTGTGRFEITEAATAVVTGFIVEVQNPTPLTVLPKLPTSGYPILQEKDFYKELRLRGYHYSGAFRGVHEARSDGLYGKVKWDLNWVAFMDCLLQISILGKDTRTLFLPTRVLSMRINAKEHMNATTKLNPENPCFEVQCCPELGMLRAGGIEIVGLSTNPVSRRKPPGIPILESYKFIPYLCTSKLGVSDAIRVCVQLLLENNPIPKGKVIEVDVDKKKPIIQYFEEALGDLPSVSADLILLTPQDLNLGKKIIVEDDNLSTQTNCAIVVASNCITRSEFVEKSQTSMAEKAFLISRENHNINTNNIPELAGFQLICILPIEDETLIVFQRSKRKIMGTPVVINISSRDYKYEWIDKLRASIKHSSVILVTEKEELSGIMGLVNCIRKEPDGTRATCVFIDDKTAPPFDLETPLYKNQLKLGLAMNVYRNGGWGHYRHLQLNQILEEKPRNDHCFGNQLQRGDLSTLTWMKGFLNLAARDDIVTVQYCSINFRDIMLASGRLNSEVFGTNRLDQECILGFEFAGVNRKGERLMGVVISGAMATHVIPTEHLTWIVPDKWSLREAATCPVVYLTVYSAFFLYDPISKGKSILIHAGSGGIGLAAIRVALAYGLEVYTTVSTPRKKQFIMETFPQLKESHIGNSRDCSFETMIKISTKGKGVDYVLNSLSDDKLHASIRCLGSGGTFLEIGKFDLSNDTKIGLGSFLKEITFRAVLVDNLFTSTADDRRQVTDLVAKDLYSGIIQPLYSNLFQVDELEKAYRFLGTGKHVGKVVIKVRENLYDEFTVPIKVLPRCYFDAELVYIIPGGIGGFGLELADWMVVRGARKLVLSSKRGITKQYQPYRIKIWEDYGCRIIINTSDITTIEGCEKLFKEAETLGPIGGIFNLAVTLRDNILENQTSEKFIECLAPKAMATKHFDELSRKLCPQLKYFVVFSSVSCGRGNAGQSNYGMANSVMESIIERRVANGFPGKAIQWGAIGEVGLVADMAEDKLDMEISGTLQQRISSCLQELDVLLTTPDPIVASMVVAEKRAGSGGSGDLIECVLNIMGIRDIKSIPMTATLSEVGMDSLMAVEIKQTLEREFDIFLTPQELRTLTFTKLTELADSRNKESTESVKLKLANENKIVGLNLMVRNLGDEETSNEVILRLRTLNNFEKFDSCILFIPGIEGVAGISWHRLCSNISLPGFCLQLTGTIDCISIPDIANSVAQDVIDVFAKKEFFYLVGYSFGTFVTLELARILEQNGMKGHVLLIDGAPVFLKKLSYGHINTEITDESIQIVLLMILFENLLPDENPEAFYTKITESQTWVEKVDKILEYGKIQSEYSDSYMRMMTQSMFNRLKIVFEVDTDNVEKISSSITLVRPSEVAVVDMAEDYELSRFTEGKINIKYVEGDHTSMLENPKLTKLINEADPNSKSDRDFKANIASGKQNDKI